MTSPVALVTPPEEQTFNAVQEISDATFNFLIGDELVNAAAFEGGSGDPSIDASNAGLSFAANSNIGEVPPGLHETQRVS